MRVLIAPDSFKGSLDAAAVARAIATGWRAARPADDITEIPLADGGEGTLAAIAAATPGSVLHPVRAVTGPDNRPVDAHWLQLPGGRAVVELASSSGLPLMSTLDPLNAHTRGLGEVLRAARAHPEITAISLAVGGSASTDAGIGALAALGARFLDATGSDLRPGGAALRELSTVDTSALRSPPPAGVEILADVTTPLYGPTGAAAVFAPQKGATPAQVARLDDALTHLAAILGGAPTAPGAGAAGGTAYGFATLWSATIIPGASRIAEFVSLPDHIANADIVITGEGRLDATSLAGKLTGYVADLATAANRPVLAIAGQSDPTVPWPGPTPATLTALAGTPEAAIADPVQYLTEAAMQLARMTDRRT